MSGNTKIGDMLDSSMEKLRKLIDVNTIIGDPIKIDGMTILPVSKVSFGYAGGGSDLPTSKPGDLFGGGTGAGVTVQPIAFLIIKPEGVQLLQLANANNITERALNLIPEIADKITSLVKKDNKAEGVSTTLAEQV